MSFSITGKIIAIFPTEYKGQDGKFATRNFVLELEGQYPQQVQFQAMQDKCDLLDLHTVGNHATVHFDLRGRAWINDKGETKYFTTLNAWRIEKHGSEQPAPAQAQSAPRAAPAPDSAQALFGDDDTNDDLPF